METVTNIQKLKIGERVVAPKLWSDEIITIKSIGNNVLGISMVGFEEKGDIRVSEHYLKRNIQDNDLKMSDVLPGLDQMNSYLNGIATTTNMMDQEKLKKTSFTGGVIFFSPNPKMVKWLVEYSGNRTIVDVGSGSGHLLNLLWNYKKDVMGIEPLFSPETYYRRLMHKGIGGRIIHVLPKKVQDCGSILNTLANNKKGLLCVFARPCHGTYVEEGIDLLPEGVECLYITKPENMDLYDDLGKYRSRAKILDHEGRSKEEEVVYSIVK